MTKKVFCFLFIGALLLELGATGANAETADRIWSGGPIITLNEAAMNAEAVAEKGGELSSSPSTQSM